MIALALLAGGINRSAVLEEEEDEEQEDEFESEADLLSEERVCIANKTNQQQAKYQRAMKRRSDNEKRKEDRCSDSMSLSVKSAQKRHHFQ